MTTSSKTISLLSYIEPVLMKLEDYTAHPAFAKLFLNIHMDTDNQLVLISRKDRNNNNKIFCAIGFTNNEKFLFNFSREDVVFGPVSTSPDFKNCSTINCNANFIPDPCVFIKKEITLMSKEQKSISLFK